MKQVHRPCPAELLSFSYDWREAGKPTNHLFESQLIPSSEAIAIVRRLNHWRLHEIGRFQDNALDLGFNVQAANEHFQQLLGMDYQEVDRLRFRTNPSNNIKSLQRTVTIYLPQILSFDSVGKVA